MAPEVHNGTRLRSFFQLSTYVATVAFFCLPNPPVYTSKGELLTQYLVRSVELITSGTIIILLGYFSGDYFAAPLGVISLFLGICLSFFSERIRADIRLTDSFD